MKGFMLFLITSILTVACISGPVMAMTDAQRAFYSANDILYYDDSDNSNANCGTVVAGSCSLLADVRRSLTEGISEADKIKIYKTYLSETPNNPNTEAGKALAQAHMEAFLNRAVGRYGGSTPADLQKEFALLSAYYGGLCPASRNCDARVVEFRSELDQIFETVLNGSNLVKFATDNASKSKWKIAESKPRNQLMCGMSASDTECKTDDYGVDDTWPDGIQDGIEYFFNNNGFNWSNKMKQDCAVISTEASYEECDPCEAELPMDKLSIRKAFDVWVDSKDNDTGSIGPGSTECATFSRWFVNTYTTLGASQSGGKYGNMGLGSGYQVTTMINLPKVTSASGIVAPAVYSVPGGVATWGGSGNVGLDGRGLGHTGIIIAVNGDEATVLDTWSAIHTTTQEAGAKYTRVSKFSIKEGIANGVTFVNLGDHIKCSGGQLISGGMTLAQAKEFMKEYQDLQKKYEGDPRRGVTNLNDEDGKHEVYFANCGVGSPLKNCSTFTSWFTAKYTTGKQAHVNGNIMVKSLLATNSGYTSGNVPKPYAVFSSTGPISENHTGIVLGINKEANKIYIGEAGCSSLPSFTGAHEYVLSNFTNNSKVTYAYTDKILKKEKIKIL